MKAKLEELDGKYYGTYVYVRDDDCNETSMQVWCCGNYIPSDRQLESWGYTRKQWDNNELIDDYYGDGKIPIREADLIHDSHFESRWTHEFCLKLIDAINKMEG